MAKKILQKDRSGNSTDHSTVHVPSSAVTGELFIE